MTDDGQHGGVTATEAEVFPGTVTEVGWAVFEGERHFRAIVRYEVAPKDLTWSVVWEQQPVCIVPVDRMKIDRTDTSPAEVEGRARHAAALAWLKANSDSSVSPPTDYISGWFLSRYGRALDDALKAYARVRSNASALRDDAEAGHAR